MGHRKQAPVTRGDFLKTASLATAGAGLCLTTPWGSAPLAAATLICLPVILLALLIQRHLVSGLTLGGVKG